MTTTTTDVPALADSMVTWLTHVARTQTAQIEALEAQVRELQIDNAHLEHNSVHRCCVDCAGCATGGGRGA